MIVQGFFIVNEEIDNLCNVHYYSQSVTNGILKIYLKCNLRRTMHLFVINAA